LQATVAAKVVQTSAPELVTIQQQSGPHTHTKKAEQNKSASTEDDHDEQHIYTLRPLTPLTPLSYAALPPYPTATENDQAEWREVLIAGEITLSSSTYNLSNATNFCPISDKTQAKRSAETTEVREIDEKSASALQTLFDEKSHSEANSDEKLKANDEITWAMQAKISEKKPTVESNGSTTKGTDIELPDTTQTKLLGTDLPTCKMYSWSHSTDVKGNSMQPATQIFSTITSDTTICPKHFRRQVMNQRRTGSNYSNDMSTTEI
jgi:hypothetical protein